MNRRNHNILLILQLKLINFIESKVVFDLFRFLDENGFFFATRCKGLHFFSRRSLEISFCLRVVFCPAIKILFYLLYSDYLGGMRSAPSSRMQQPLSMIFSIMCSIVRANS